MMPTQAADPHRRGRALYEEIKGCILEGTFPPGSALPSTRALAAERGLSRTTVTLVYEQLSAEGFIETRAGAASRVARGAVRRTPLPGRAARAGRQASAAQGTTRLSAMGERIAALRLPPIEEAPVGFIDFAYGPLSGRDFPTLMWRRAARQVESERPPRLAYEDPRGDLSLRRALQAYLARARGITCGLDQLVIVNGSQQALDLCARVLLDANDEVVVENPGYRMAHHVFEVAGARLRGVDVDAQGLRTDALRQLRSARLAYVTPTHQFPLGGFLPMARRHELLAWAAVSQAWIIEDDYDSEYRYAVRPEPSLQSLDEQGRVIYVGTFSKTLSPQLRLGYMVLPQSVAQVFSTAKRLADRHAVTGSQRTLARLLEDGSYERHVRRVRRLQQARREALLVSLQRHLGARITVQGAGSGLHVVVWINGTTGGAESDLVSAARRERVIVHPIGPLFIPQRDEQSGNRCAGLVMGYAALDEAQIDLGVKRLKVALRHLK